MGGPGENIVGGIGRPGEEVCTVVAGVAGVAFDPGYHDRAGR